MSSLDPRSAGLSWQEGTREFYTSRSETMRTAAGKSRPSVSSKETLVHEILERVADKWTLLVIDALDGKREVRFSRLRERIGGVSQKMLTKTLRQLERDGLVTRRVHAESHHASTTASRRSVRASASPSVASGCGWKHICGMSSDRDARTTRPYDLARTRLRR
jgi:DNA-binding HxlR family transcriptional regulator